MASADPATNDADQQPSQNQEIDKTKPPRLWRATAGIIGGGLLALGAARGASGGSWSALSVAAAVAITLLVAGRAVFGPDPDAGDAADRFWTVASGAPLLLMSLSYGRDSTTAPADLWGLGFLIAAIAPSVTVLAQRLGAAGRASPWAATLTGAALAAALWALLS